MEAEFQEMESKQLDGQETEFQEMESKGLDEGPDSSEQSISNAEGGVQSHSQSENPGPTDSGPTDSGPTHVGQNAEISFSQMPSTLSPDYSPQDFRMLRKAIKESSLLHLSFYFLDYVLRAQTALFEQIHSQQGLSRIIVAMTILCSGLSAIYGATMGMNHSVWLALSSTLKLPCLFLITATICIPSLYTFNVLLGQRFKFLQTVALMTMTLATTTILLASLAPLSLFFVLTTKNYHFLKLMHVAVLGLCGLYGVQYLYRGCTYIAFRMEQPLNKLLLRVWIAIYAVVGMQLGWRLRPFIGSPGPFEVFRSQGDSNFYITVWQAFVNLLGPPGN
jgi:hypothetical protein